LHGRFEIGLSSRSFIYGERACVVCVREKESKGGKGFLTCYFRKWNIDE
jgi:hypothetical protein